MDSKSEHTVQSPIKSQKIFRLPHTNSDL